MPFKLEDLAAELGIDVATIQAKPEVATKWNGYLADADNKYSQASAAEKAAQAKLDQIENEQRTINESIASFGMTEANVTALRANNAAMEAQLKALKDQGLEITIPTMPANPTDPKPAAFDPTAFRQDVNQSLIHGFDMNNRYQRLYGKAMPDDLAVLLSEATAARKPLPQYVAEKYDFTGEEKRQTTAAQTKRDEEIAAAAVKKYQDANPNTSGNPEFARGIASRHPMIVREREVGDNKTFSNLTARQKIAQSIGRSISAIQKAS